MGNTRGDATSTTKTIGGFQLINPKKPLSRAEINKRYRLRDPERFKEQNRKAYMRRKARLETIKEIEILNEVLQSTE